MTEPAPQAAPKGAAAPIDLADLVSLLVSMQEPSRVVDCVVEAMLGGERAHQTVTPATVITGRWLAQQAPEYTAGGQALSVLARRRGMKVRCVPDGRGFRAESYEPQSGRSASAVARTEGCAGVAAIARLSSEGMR